MSSEIDFSKSVIEIGRAVAAAAATAGKKTCVDGHSSDASVLLGGMAFAFALVLESACANTETTKESIDAIEGFREVVKKMTSPVESEVSDHA